MIIRACAFTDKGNEIINKLIDKMPEHLFEIRDKAQDLKEWAGEGFGIHAPIIFVGATGIAVRTIAPFVEDKLTDSPVVVIDDNGKFVIPILSGHMGGANALSNDISKVLDATAVITTATDVNGLFSVDVFAAGNCLKVVNRDGIRKVSSKLLKEKEIRMEIEKGIEIKRESFPTEVKLVTTAWDEGIDVYVGSDKMRGGKAVLWLMPKQYVLGVGCKKGMNYENVAAAVNLVLSVTGISLDDVSILSSIDLKAKERGLLAFSSINHIPFVTYTADELNAIEGEFTESEFVKSVTGVSNVCERAAMAASDGGEIIVRKMAHNGVTVAVASRKVVLHG